MAVDKRDSERANLSGLLLGILLIALSIAFGDQVVYKLLIVPHLNDKIQISIWMWIAAFCPIFVSCIVVGANLGNYHISDVACTVVGSAIVNGIYLFMVSNHVGHYKSHAVESPVLFWSLGLIALIFFYGLSIGSGYLFSKFININKPIK